MPVYEVRIGNQTVEVNAPNEAAMKAQIPAIQKQIGSTGTSAPSAGSAQHAGMDFPAPPSGQRAAIDDSMKSWGKKTLTGQQGKMSDFVPDWVENPENPLSKAAVGFGRGLTAPIRAAQQLAASPEERARLAREEAARDEQLGGWGTAGNIASAFVPGLGAAKLAGGAAKLGLKGAAGLGAAQAVSQPLTSAGATEDSMGLGDFLAQKGTQAATGAALGGAGQKVGDIIGRKGSEAVREASRMLGGVATPGQLAAASGSKLGKGIQSLESQAGEWLPFSGIESSLKRSQELGAQNVLKNVADRAGLKTQGDDFRGILESAQKAKKEGYDTIAPQLRAGAIRGVDALQTPFIQAAQKLTDAEAQQLARVVNSSVPAGAFRGENIQSTLSDLNKAIKGHFSQGATASDRRIGEALMDIRDSLHGRVQQHSAPQTKEQLDKLNKAHAQLGKLEGAVGTYKSAFERGAPTLDQIVQKSLAGGKPSKHSKELAEEASKVLEYAGKQRNPSDLRDIRKALTVAGQGAAGTMGLGAIFPQALTLPIYNKKSLAMINKMAAEGNPTAQKILVQLSQAGAMGAGQGIGAQ